MIRETDVGEMRMIRVRTAESRVFCEAYFVLRRRSSRAPLWDIVAEAEKIIRDQAMPAKTRRVRRRHVGAFVLGALSGVAATACATAVALLCMTN